MLLRSTTETMRSWCRIPSPRPFFSFAGTPPVTKLRSVQFRDPKTLLQDNDELTLDTVHGEVIVPTRQAILVFSRLASGDAAPLRVIGGPKTRINRARGIAVDPVNKIIAVGNRDPNGILIFNRTDEGDVAPRAIISGPKTGIYATKGFTVNPARKELVATV